MAYINSNNQVRIGVRPWVDSGIDSSANLFFAASGLSDTTQRNAVNTLVKDLKRFGLWTKIKAFYPFVGGTADSHKWNLKDPRDSNDAYRLTFSGGWTHTSMGIKSNGSNTSANTNLSLRTVLGSTSTQHTLGIYINENPSTALSYRGDIWASDGSSTSTSNISQYSGGGTTHITDMTTNWWSWLVPITRDVRGLTEFKRYNSKYTCGFVNGYEVQDWRNMTVSPYYNPISSVNIGSSNSLNRYSSVYIADLLNSLESYLMYIAVQKFNTTLSRQISTGISSIPLNTYGTPPSLVTSGMKINLDSSNVTAPQEVLLRNTGLTDPGLYFMRNDIWPDSSGSGNNGIFQRSDNNNRSCGYFYSDELMIPEIRVHDNTSSNNLSTKIYGNNPDWIDTPYSGADNGTFTFGGWVKYNSTYTGSSCFVRGRDGSGSGWNLMSGGSVGGKFSFSVVPTSGTIVGAIHGAQINLAGTTTIQSSVWYNFYVVWKPNTFVKFYVNGVEEVSYPITIPSVRSSTVGWTINRANSGATNGKAIIGAFHVYDRDLTAAEILQNFNAQRSKYNV
jgi:hypothetical protein